MLLMGISYMIIGMGVVFFFLILLVALMIMMSKMVLRYFPEKEEIGSVVASIDRDRDIIAVIAAAIRHCKGE